MRILALVAATAITAALGGCSSEAPKPAPAPARPAFEVDAWQAGPAVFLRGRVDGDHVTVDVVARELGDLHGIAFRLHWDAEKLALVEARGSDAWSKQALVLAKEGLPGELVVTFSEKGTGVTLDAREETTLGSIDFRRSSTEGVPLAFRAERSMLLDSKGKRLAAAWRGGTIVGR
jgi:hypothetical protein